MSKAIPLGPFELECPIGQGGMGEIWRARHLEHDQLVAVKVMMGSESRDETYQEIFRNEVRSVAALDHPGIVQIFDHGEIPAETAAASGDELPEGAPYFVMEFAARGSLDRYLHALDWRRARYIVFQILDALAHAHARGVVHRDLKPANVLVGCEGGDALGLKLADFGLAREMYVEDRTDRIEKGWGTPLYMAPEQFRGRWRNFGPATDLYALGCMVWEFVTGDVPFFSENVLDMGRRHIEVPLPEFEPRFTCPDRLEAWLRRLLEKDFRDRFQLAADAAWGLLKIDSELAFDDGGDRLRGTPGLLDASQLPTRIDATRDFPETEPLEGGPESTTLLLDFNGSEPTRGGTATLDLDAWRDGVSGGQDGDDEDTEREASIEPEPPPIPRTWRSENDDAHPAPLVGAGLELFGLRHVRIVDRDSERDRIWAALHEVEEQHEARCCLLAGPAGTGKSRLASWVTERAMELGAARILRAVHSPISGPVDGLPGMLLRHFHCVGLDGKATRERVAAELQALGVTEPYEWTALTELALPGHTTDEINSDLRQTRVRFSSNRQRYAVLRRFVERLARQRPVIVWLDDIQWGADSLGFVEHMLDMQSASRTPILFVLTARDESLRDRAVERSLVKRLLSSELSEQVDVEPLTPEDTHRLLRRLLRLDDNLARQVGRRADGNPLFAVQLVDDWVTSGKLRVGDRGFELEPGASVRVPRDIYQLWRDRVAGVRAAGSHDDFVALLAAATLGQEVERDEWRAVCDELELEVDSDLEDELYRRGLASHIEGGWMFVHGLLRETLEEMASNEQMWRPVNLACADALERLYGVHNRQTARRRAEHLLEAGELARAVGPLLEAARLEAERASFDAAEDLLDRRSQVLDELECAADAEARVRGWIVRAELHILEAEYGEALQWADRAQKTARAAGHSEELDDALRVEGGVERHLGHYRQARDLLEESIERAVATGDVRAEGLSVLELARVEERQANWDEARRLLSRAHDLLDEAGETFGLARCFNALGDIARQTGALEHAHEFTLEARERFESEGMRSGVADCVNDLAEIAVLEGEIVGAEQMCKEALQLYESIGSARSMGVRLTLGFVMQERAKWDDAAVVLERARAFFSAADMTAELARCDALLLASLAHAEGAVELEPVLEQLEELVDGDGAARLGAGERDRLEMAAEASRTRGWSDVADRIVTLVDDAEKG